MESVRYESLINIPTILAGPELGHSLLTLLPTAQPWNLWFRSRLYSFRGESLSLPATLVDLRLPCSFTIWLLEPELVSRIRGHCTARYCTAPQPALYYSVLLELHFTSFG